MRKKKHELGIDFVFATIVTVCYLSYVQIAIQDCSKRVIKTLVMPTRRKPKKLKRLIGN